MSYRNWVQLKGREAVLHCGLRQTRERGFLSRGLRDHWRRFYSVRGSLPAGADTPVPGPWSALGAEASCPAQAGEAPDSFLLRCRPWRGLAGKPGTSKEQGRTSNFPSGGTMTAGALTRHVLSRFHSVLVAMASKEGRTPAHGVPFLTS